MYNQAIKNQLKTMYTSIHDYCHYLLQDLPTDIYTWSSGSKKDRSIRNYLCHMVNTESFWLYSIQSHTIPFVNENIAINDILHEFQKLQTIYLDLLNQTTSKDLQIIPTEFPKKSDANGKPFFEQKGSFAWIILRVIIHNYGHLSQITAILYSLEIKKPYNADINWWSISESFINLAKFLRID